MFLETIRGLKNTNKYKHSGRLHREDESDYKKSVCKQNSCECNLNKYIA